MKRLFLLVIIGLFSLILEAQIFDNYGFRIGTGLSNSIDIYTGIDPYVINLWWYPKVGFSFYTNAEKKLTDFLSIRPEIGYNQKGWIYDHYIRLSDGSLEKSGNDGVVFDNLSLDLTIIIKPFSKNRLPYLILGFRSDYMLNHRGTITDKEGTTYQDKKSEINNYNKISLSGLLGLGFEFNDLIYLDIEYNPLLSKYYEDSEGYITGRYSGITLGINMNNFKNDD